MPLPIELQSVIENKLSVSADKVSDVLRYVKDQIGMPALTSQHIESGIARHYITPVSKLGL